MTKECGLKGQQKLFFLHINQAASCCRADPISLSDKSIEDCIDLWNHEHEQLKHGVELPGCRHCWQAENTGQQSYRQQMIGYNKNYVEIFISNLCNQMCSYCSPKFSSSWKDNIQQYGNFENISKSAKDNLAVNTIYTDHTTWITELTNFLNCGPVSLRLLGGEPLMQKRNLQQLLELNTNQITSLHITTNLNPPDNKFLKWVLETFPKDKLKFEISLDTIPTHNAIPRAGFNQHRFEENLNLLEQHNVSFSFLSVVSILNIFSISEYQKWANQKKYQVKFFRINNPECLDPCYLPDQFKQLILDATLPEPAQQSLKYLPQLVDLKQFEQYNYLKQYFQRTNTKITDTNLLKYWNWLEEKFK